MNGFLGCSKLFKSESSVCPYLQMMAPAVDTNILNNNENGNIYNCDHCKKTFTNKSNLLSHVNLYKGKDLFQCNLCPKSFNTIRKLISHSKSHSGVRPFECDICDRRYSERQSLSAHYRLHVEGNTLTCAVCTKKFGKKSSLQRHLLIHKGEKPHKCDVCMKTFVQKSQLTTHAKIHSDIKPYLCDLCGRKMSRKDALIAHLKTHNFVNENSKKIHKSTGPVQAIENLDKNTSKIHPIKESENKCHQNENFWNNKYSSQILHNVSYLKLTEDVKWNTGQEKNTLPEVNLGPLNTKGLIFDLKSKPPSFPIANPLLTKLQKGTKDLEIITLHTNESNPLDDSCSGSDFDSKTEVRKEFLKTEQTALKEKKKEKLVHTKQIGAKIEDNFNCSICGNNYAFRSSLSAHMRLHTLENVLKCNTCSKVFCTQSKYLAHLQTHTGVKPFSCDVCEKQFTEKHSLAEHFRIHLGDRPHGCTHCDKRFSKKVTLERHILTHTGFRPHQCEQCHRRFTQKSQLVNHQRTHSLERPFLCTLCGRGFGRNDALKVHCKTHTMKHLINDGVKTGRVCDRKKLN